MLRSYLCDYSDAYIVVKTRISVGGTNLNNQANKMLSLKNNASLRSSISKINNILVSNAENLHIVMPMHNLLKYFPLIN